MAGRLVRAAALAAALGGCASYRPLPLKRPAPLPDAVPRIRIDPALMPLAALREHTFDPSNGLDETEVAMLAVVSNPELRVARDKANVARAQAFAAGLLPDPQLAATRDRPTGSGPDLHSAYSVGLSEDIAALLTYSATRAAGRARAHSADLGLLWQEWQVVAKARTLFVRLTEWQRLRAVLEENRRLFADRYARTKKALDKGLVTLDAVTPNLTALQDVERQIHDLERRDAVARQDLNALLGLAPEAEVPLAGAVSPRPLDERAVLASLPELAKRRPDLVALRYGYEAQDRTYRAAVLNQFPAFTLGFNSASDTAGVHTVGFGVTLALPFFDGNRGRIDVERATRRQLYDEYQLRVRRAGAEVRRLLVEYRINARQLEQVDGGVAALSDAAAKAQKAFAAGAIDALAFASLRSALLAKRIEQIDLQESMLEQRVALAGLTGSEW